MAEKRIRRFNALQQAVHWILAVSFVVQLLTGAFLYVPQFAAYTIGPAGKASRLLHRVGFVGLVLAALLYLIGDFRSLGADMREIFSWSGEDIAWLWAATTRYYWTGDSRGMPPQGRYNAGQKLNYLVQVLGFLILLITGLVMWFGVGAVPAALWRWMVFLHDIAATFVVGFFALHLYLSTLHPLSKESITAIFLGTVSEEYAKEHHPRWYEQVKGKGS